MVQFGRPLTISDAGADDSQVRWKLGVNQELADLNSPIFNEFRWNLYIQDNETEQRTLEDRTSGPSRIRRTGAVDFSHQLIGTEILFSKVAGGQNHSHRITYGIAYEHNDFEQLRDRRDLDLITGNPNAYDGPLFFPTRYFPKSEATELGLFIQSESFFFDDRLKVIPRTPIRPL